MMKIAICSILLMAGASQPLMAQSSLLELQGKTEFKKQSPQVLLPAFSESNALVRPLLEGQSTSASEAQVLTQAPEKVYSSMLVYQPQGKQTIPAAQPDPAIQYQLLVKEVEIVPPVK